MYLLLCYGFFYHQFACIELETKYSKLLSWIAYRVLMIFFGTICWGWTWNVTLLIFWILKIILLLQFINSFLQSHFWTKKGHIIWWNIFTHYHILVNFLFYLRIQIIAKLANWPKNWRKDWMNEKSNYIGEAKPKVAKSKSSIRGIISNKHWSNSGCRLYKCWLKRMF